MTEQRFNSREMALAAGITVESFYEYRRRGLVPEPDGVLWRTPYWRRSTRNAWLRSRRPRGRPKAIAE